jgi:hypothetical protein
MTIQAPWRNLVAEPVKHDHLVQVYRNERVLVEAVSLFASAAIGRREAVILIATMPHAVRVERCLEDEGFEVEELKRWGQLTILDAGEVLSRFMVDGMPDPDLFKAVIRELMASVNGSGRFRAVRAYGEMVNLLWTANLPAALRLEELWNEVILEHGISLFCAYSLDGEGQSERMFPPDLRTLHNHLIPLEGGA